MNRIQRFQSKTLHSVTKAPFYASNLTLQNYLLIPHVYEVAKAHYKRFRKHLFNHKNPLISEIQDPNIPSDPKKDSKIGGVSTC